VRVSQAYFDVLLAQDTLSSIAAQKAAIAEQLAQAKREFEVGTKTILDTNEAQARFDLMLAQEAVAQGDELSKRAALALLVGTDHKTLAKLKNNAVVPSPMPSDLLPWTTRAAEASISVQSAQIAADIAKIDIARNKALNGPSLDLVSSLNGNRSVGSASSAARSSTANASIGLQLSYPLYSGGGLDSKVREAAINHDKALFDLEAAKRNASQAARQSYLSLNYGIAQIKALESAERSSVTLLDSTKLGYQVGVRINLDVLNAQQTLANNRKDLAKARYDSLMAGLRLKAATAQLSEEDLRSVNAQLQ
jgi:outer membrane protein